MEWNLGIREMFTAVASRPQTHHRTGRLSDQSEPLFEVASRIPQSVYNCSSSAGRFKELNYEPDHDSQLAQGPIFSTRSYARLDEAGKSLGVFLPNAHSLPGEPFWTREELDASFHESGGRSLDEILNSLSGK